MILGELSFRAGGRTLKATLDSAAGWKCDDAVTAHFLNSLYSLKGWYGSPSAGALGKGALADAADRLNGTFEFFGGETETDPFVVM